jgi:hypothetical protein
MTNSRSPGAVQQAICDLMLSSVHAWVQSHQPSWPAVAPHLKAPVRDLVVAAWLSRRCRSGGSNTANAKPVFSDLVDICGRNTIRQVAAVHQWPLHKLAVSVAMVVAVAVEVQSRQAKSEEMLLSRHPVWMTSTSRGIRWAATTHGQNMLSVFCVQNGTYWCDIQDSMRRP